MNKDLLKELRARELARRNTLTPEERAREDAESAAYRAWRDSDRGRVIGEIRDLMERLYPPGQEPVVEPHTHCIRPIESMRLATMPFDLGDSEAHKPGEEERRAQLPSLKHLQLLLDWLKGDRSAPMPPEAEGALTLHSRYCCGRCGADILLRFQGMGTFRIDTDCPLPAGPFVVQIPILSGVLAIGNDFRDFAPIDWKGMTSENLMNNRRAVTFTAAHGVVFSQLHEDRGRIHRQADGSFLVGGDITGEPVPELYDLGGYWRSFADGDLIPQDTPRVYRVPVLPGIYAFTLHYLDRDWDRETLLPDETEAPYITIRRVEEEV